ncbi:DoxX family protein [Nocardia sp. NPDC057663]|uniref:DoxX family protein n=1 Tax=Nocardia sp. NPDC057663 TaxID=3346201 RepID=UPI003672A5D1
MNIISTVLAGVLAAEFAAFGGAKLAAIAPMRARAEHLGVTPTAFRGVGALEAAGAAGVLLGLAYPWIGVAAGTGLALLMGGAIVSHVRRGDGVIEIVPAAGSGLVAVAYIVTAAGSIQ